MEKCFLDLCKKYAEEKSAIFSEHTSNKKRCVFKLELRAITIEFCYAKKSTVFISPSTLYCRIFLRKNSVMYYHIPEILTMTGKQDFRSCYFPFIENEARMKLCFGELVNILETHLSDIEMLTSEDKINNNDVFESYKRIYKLKEKDINFSLIDVNEYDTAFFKSLQSNRDGYLVNLFTVSSAYSSLLLGNREKALLLYAKREQKDGLMEYEKSLVDFLQSDKGKDFSPMPEKCLTLPFGTVAAKPSLGELALNTVIAYLPFAGLFCAIFLVTNLIVSANTVFSFCPPWYGGLLVAGLCGIFGGLGFRNQIKRILKGKSAQTAIEMDKLVNSRTLNRFIYVFFALVLAFSLFATFMIMSCHALFYENSFKYTNEEGIWQYSEYSYSDIESVYYMKSRYNDYGEVINRSSYVLEMNDGGILDFDAFTTNEEAEETIIPFLKDKGFVVKTIASDKELKNKASNKSPIIVF